MEAIGSEVGLKMRSAIKAKLMELGCYVDDELPDYVMVMVANKRTRSQMEEDLQLFLSQNTEAFVSWLHQVLQKLQEVTINTKLVSNMDSKSSKYKPSKKERKKEKEKIKSKEKVKIKSKKAKKERTKKADKTSESESIRPNVPRLLMNLEKESSPSITDVFAGQILRKHGILPSNHQNSNNTIVDADKKTIVDMEPRKSIKNRLPIIDPATVPDIDTSLINKVDTFDIPTINEISISKSKDSNDIVSVVDKEKNADNPLNDSGSDCEDFINLRTEAEDLIGVGLEEETSRTEAKTPPLPKRKLIEPPSNDKKTNPPEDSMHIELNLPKRSLKDRLGVREDNQKKRNINLVNPFKPNEYQDEDNNSSHRPDERMHSDKSNSKRTFVNSRNIKSRLSLNSRESRRVEVKVSKDNFTVRKKLGSRVVSLPPEDDSENNRTVAVASVVRAPPRPQHIVISAGPQMLLRAMADAHKSLLNMPPKFDVKPVTKQRALVMPIRRNVHPQKIIIEVPTGNIQLSKSHEQLDSNSDFEIDMETESLDELEKGGRLKNENEYIPEPLGCKVQKVEVINYVPTHIETSDQEKESDPDNENSSSKNENPSLHSVNPQFVVTLDGLDPNVFLEKKLEMISRESENEDAEGPSDASVTKEKIEKEESHPNVVEASNFTTENAPKNITITFDGNGDRIKVDRANKQINNSKCENVTNISKLDDDVEDAVKVSKRTKSPPEPVRKRRASPIVFNSNDIKTTKVRLKVDGNSTKGSKYESMPSLPLDNVAMAGRERCKYFPDCQLGDSCDFYHPACKYDPSCVRVDCPYSHNAVKPKSKGVASHVVTSMNYKTISPQPAPASNMLCRFYPNCSKYDCVWYHPTAVACKYGKKCANKSDCGYYHRNVSALKWKSN